MDGLPHPGIVYPDIDLPEVRFGSIPQGLHLSVVGDVAGLAEDAFGRILFPKRFTGLVDGLLGAASDDDLATAGQESTGQAVADAAGGAGDDDGFHSVIAFLSVTNLRTYQTALHQNPIMSKYLQIGI